MNITKLSERSRLQRIIREAPDDIDARKGLASLFLESGDFVRAAAELMSISRVHVARGEGKPARDSCRQALEFDAGNLELRLLLAQIHARFPAREVRAAAPIVEVLVEAPAGEPIFELAPAPRLQEVSEVLGEIPVVNVDVGLRDAAEDMFSVGETAQERPVGRRSSREEINDDFTSFQVGVSDLIEIPDAIGYKDEVTAPTGAVAQISDEIASALDPMGPSAEQEKAKTGRSSEGNAVLRSPNALGGTARHQTGSGSRIAVGSDASLSATPFSTEGTAPRSLFSSSGPPDPGSNRTAPIAVARVTPPRPKSAPPRAAPVQGFAPSPVKSNRVLLPDPFESPGDNVIEAESPSDYSGLGVDDETPRPPQFSETRPGSSDSTRAGIVDLSPRPTSGGFDQRVSAMERFRGESPPERTVVGPAPDHFVLSDIPPNPLTDRLPKAAREALFSKLVYVEYTDEAAVIDAGRQLEALMLIQEGVVRVVNGPLAGDATDLCRMSEGELIGAFEFLTRSHSRVSLQAEGRVGMLELPKAASDELRREDAQIGDAIRAVLRERLVSNLMDQAPIFASVSTDQRRDLAGRFFTVDVESAEPILQQGEINRRLFLLQFGELVVDSRGGKGGRMTLHPGDFFGFVSTLLGRPVQVAVVASAPSSLLVLPEQEVYRLVAGNKGVARAARREAVERGDQPISVHSVGGLGGLLVRRPGLG
ncbi:MAG: CRP-like cAMP-binding protein [Bradymonadia bacterium]|jgi:CRP-like cAMP-binding protein